MSAPIFIQQGGFGLSGLGASAEAEEREMMLTLKAATAVRMRKTIGAASAIAGVALIASGLMSRSAAKWPTTVIGAGAAGYGGWLLANVQSEKVFFWEK